MTLLLLATLAQICAAIAAEKFALRRPEHRPVARALALLTGASLTRACLAQSVLAEPGPYNGWARVGFHLEEALFLLSPVALAWLPIRVLRAVECILVETPNAARTLHLLPLITMFVTVWWAILVALCVLLYPDLRGEPLGKLYLGVQFVSLFLGCGAVLSWARRGDWRDISPTVLSVLALLAVELLSLLTGPWARGLFGQAWEAEQGAQLALYSALTLFQFGAFLSASRRP